MKRNITKRLSRWLVAAMLAMAPASAVGQTQIVLETEMGNIRLKLNDEEAPLHSKNFRTLVEQGFYDGLLFHRLGKNFVIQAGDPNSKDAEPGALLGDTQEPYTVPAEIDYPRLMHKRGALCMAREGDDVNPERASSAYQFYIVYGRKFDEEALNKMQARLDDTTGGQVKLTPEVRKIYKTVGGLPHLDGQYTVFGEVVDGLDVVSLIQMVDADENGRPLTDMRILRAYVEK